ncbi:Ig-like domain-containing protein [Haloferax sp. AB510]|uniref:Ig-like domain-containing protein n=1 Tax=Haloferax sp. AB510 TaxID=2934172 RepID=UPI00209C18D2|nr:Ig-like domain-containing protein [Haloferax sp. AB510]MCO8266635.1 Ig-like domain-containing protein [Haloferax sp. AB510]
MRRLSIVLFALFASFLVVSVAPVSAADGDLVVGSENDTDDELQNGTLTNVTVNGNGEAAHVELSDGEVLTQFSDEEDGDVTEYTGDTSFLSAVSSPVADGSYAVQMDTDGNRREASNTIPVSSADSYSFEFKNAQSSLSTNNEILFTDGGTVVWGFYFKLGEGIYWSDAGERTAGELIAGIDVTSNYHSISIKNIDTAANTVDIYLDGTYQDTYSFHNSGANPDAYTLASNAGQPENGLLVDRVAYAYNQTVSNGTYISSIHNVTNANEGRVTFDALTDVDATVSWQENTGGTWTNITTGTYTTSGTKSADLSSTTSDELRVRVDFSTSGPSPNVELDRDAVYFPVSTPDISAGPSAPSGGEVVHTSAPTLSVDVSDDDFGTTQGDQLSITWRVNGSVVDTTTRTTNGTASITAPSLPDGNHTWSVTVDDSYGETVSSNFSFEVQHFEPTITNLEPPDDTSLSTRDITLSANLTDSDFAFEGDELTAEFLVDGSVVGTEVLTSNGTASTTYTMEGGSASWSVRVTDNYGNIVTSPTRTIRSPSTLTIRNVSTGEPITGSAQVTAKLYSGELIFSKNTTDGTIDLTGVPVERGYIIEVTVDGYVTRTVAIESVFEQGDIYLLPESTDAVYQEMTLNDQTGDFEASSTVLYIERPIERNGTIEWRVVTGDYFGADSVFKTTLEKDQRYRLVIENDDGDRRELGAYIAAANGTAPLDVGTIQWQAPKGDTYQWDAFVDENISALRVMYSDPEDETTSFDVVVHERGDPNETLFESDGTNLSSFQRTEPLSQSELEQDWVVNITLERNSQTITIDEPISSTASIRTPVPIDTRWATLAGLVLLVALAAAFPSTLSRVGAVAVVSVATGITWLGWVDIPMSVIGLSGAVALLGLAASFNSY